MNTSPLPSSLLPAAATDFTVTLVGGGNACHLVSAYIGSHPNCNVHIFNSLSEECGRLRKGLSEHNNTITAVHVDGRDDVVGKVKSVTDNAAEVIPSSDMVIVTVPGFTHEMYLKEIEKHVSKNTIIGVLVGLSGIHWCFQHAFGQKTKDLNLSFFTLDTLPWAARIADYGSSVTVLGTKQTMNLGALPKGKSEEFCRLVEGLWGMPRVESRTDDAVVLSKDLFPKFKPMTSFLAVAVSGETLHPSILYGKFKDWDMKQTFSETPLFYQGVDEFTGKVIEETSAEIMQIKAKIIDLYPQLAEYLSDCTTVFDWLLTAYEVRPNGSHLTLQGQIADTSSVQQALVTNKAYDGLTHKMKDTGSGLVPDVEYRYFTEDLPYGLVCSRGIAEILNIDTPMMDKVLMWNQKMIGKEYLKDGKLQGKDIGETRAPQRYGLTTLEDVVRAEGLLQK